MYVITFDIGVKNLAFCYVNVNPDNTFSVLEWNCVSIIDKETKVKKIGISELTDVLLDYLVNNFGNDKPFDYIFIENQPAVMNGLMKSISMVVYTFFKMKKQGIVQFINVTNKLKCSKNPNKTMKGLSYNDRKKLAIHLTKEYLQEKAPEKIEWFNKIKKADDYSDTFLYIIYAIENGCIVNIL